MLEIKELLDAGVHFGHPQNRWNPRMARYIFGARDHVHIIDLQKTVRKFTEAFDFLRDRVASGESLLFVGTKRQAQAVIEEGAKQSDMFYVTQRWLGGMLTNFATIRKGVDRLQTLETFSQDGTYDKLPKKEVMQLEKERMKLEQNLSGIRRMNHLPGAVFVIDILKERICVAEAKRLKIPVVAIVDTNCNPDDVDYAIPGNDDGIRSIRLITNKVVEAVLEGIKQRGPRMAAVPPEAAAPPVAEVSLERTDLSALPVQEVGPPASEPAFVEPLAAEAGS